MWLKQVIDISFVTIYSFAWMEYRLQAHGVTTLSYLPNPSRSSPSPALPSLADIHTSNIYCVFWSYCFTNIPWLYTFNAWKWKELTSDQEKWPLFNYLSVLEFFAGLSEADRVYHPDSELTTLEHGRSSEAGPSSYSSSPSTSGFQPNGDVTRRGSKQLANRRFSTRKHKKDWNLFLWLH